MDNPHKSGLRAGRSAAGKGWGFGTASRAVDQLISGLELVSGKVPAVRPAGENAWASGA